MIWAFIFMSILQNENLQLIFPRNYFPQVFFFIFKNCKYFRCFSFVDKIQKLKFKKRKDLPIFLCFVSGKLRNLFSLIKTIVFLGRRILGRFLRLWNELFLIKRNNSMFGLLGMFPT